MGTKRGLHRFKDQSGPELSPSVCKALKPSIPVLESPWGQWPVLWAQVMTAGELPPNKEEQRSSHPPSIISAKDFCSNNGACQVEAHKRPSVALPKCFKTCYVSSVSTDLKSQWRTHKRKKLKNSSSKEKSITWEGLAKLYGQKQMVNQLLVNVLRASLFFSKPDVLTEPSGRGAGNHWGREVRCRHMKPLGGPSIQVPKTHFTQLCPHIHGLHVPSGRGQCANCSHNTNPSVFWVSSNVYLFLIEH